MDYQYYNMTVPVFIKSLKSLRGVLKKGEAYAKEKGISVETMLAMRLAPDMLPLSKQIQIACDNAKGTTSRIAGIEAPKFEDAEVTFEEFYARIEKTIAFLETLEPAQFKDASEQKVTLPYFKDKFFIGKEFVPAYGIPNFYFHLVTAYCILRNAGVQIGKADYITELPMHDVN